MAEIYFTDIKEFYYTGDSIEGTLVLEGVRGVKARRLLLELICKRYSIRYVNSTRHESSTREVLNSIEIHGSKVYDVDKAEYDFRIEIPRDVPPTISAMDVGVEWYLYAKLDIPHARDITGKCIITVFNSSQPRDLDVKSINLENEYLSLTLDKNVFEFWEDITGVFKLYKIPSRLRSIDIGLTLDLKVIVHGSNVVSDERIYIRYPRDKIRIGEEYEFKLEPHKARPITYSSKNVESNVGFIIKLNRRFARDIVLRTPIFIYHAIEKIREAIVEKPSIRKPITPESKLIEEIRELMRDGKARDVVDIRLELGFKYDTEDVIKACDKLVEEGYLEVVESGELLKKYKIKSMS